MAKSDIAFGSEFSPEQIDLPELLAIVEKADGDKQELEATIEKRWFRAGDERAKNTVLSLLAYGIIENGDPGDDESTATSKRKVRYHLTDEGKKLLGLRAKGKTLYDELARHILLNVQGGRAVVDVLTDLTKAGPGASMGDVRDELNRRGLYHPKNGMHATRIRQWLEKAGAVTAEPYQVNQAKIDQLLGYTESEIEAFAGLTREQKDFAKAFARLGVDEARSNEVAAYATSLFRTRFPDTGLPGAVLDALKAAGLIVYQKTTGGRGAKPAIVTATDKLKSDIFEPLLASLEHSVDKGYRSLVRMSFTEVLAGVKDKNTHTKGKALEALAAKLAFILDLRFVGWRLRGDTSGGAEVDLVVESTMPVYLRWNIQCKNKPDGTARLEDIAKEVGVAVISGASVLVFVTTGRFTADAREHARKVMEMTNLTVVLIDNRDIEKIAADPAAIVGVMQRAAQQAQEIQRQREQE